MRLLSASFVVAFALVACDSTPQSPPDAAGDTSDARDTSDTRDVTDLGDVPQADVPTPDTPDTTPPTDFATVVFTIDDSANKTYTAADGLAWKASLNFDPASGFATFDATWGGPFPMLRDDGQGGDLTANDGIWTVAVKIASPESDLEFEYGAIRDSVDGSEGLWIWKGRNGTFTVPAGSTDTITVPGLVITPFGDIDLRLTLDVSNQAANLDPLFQGVSYTDVRVKGAVWSWREIPMRDDGLEGDAVAGDGVYTFVYSKNLGKHDGLLREGDEAAFVFAFECIETPTKLDCTEYKNSDGPPTSGVTAALDSGQGFVPVPILKYPDGDKNTYVVASATRPPFEPPAGHVAVNFTLDDTANKTYDVTDGLAWKGQFDHDATTRTIAYRSAWTGPFAMLHDDGPWDQGGHEPLGSVAGDHRWGVTAWVPNTSTQTFAYGAIRGSNNGSDGSWIWTGADGSFTVTAGATAPITVQGLVIAPHGTTDLKLTIDVSNNGASLATLFQGANYTDQVQAKGSAWGWTVLPAVDDGTDGDELANDGVYTFTLSARKGKHDGLLKAGEKAEFLFVLSGEDYRDMGAVTTLGVKAYTRTATGSWTEATIGTSGTNNPVVSAP